MGVAHKIKHRQPSFLFINIHRMKYSFHTVAITDIDGKDSKVEVHKTLANALYSKSKDLDLVEKARIMNKGEEIELDKTEIEEIKKVIKDPQIGFFAFVQKALLDYIDSIKEPKA